MTEERFDELLDDLAQEPVDAPTLDAAKARVWDNLKNAPCLPFRQDLPAYLAGTLLESRRLLVHDHLGRCAGCRQMLQSLKAPGQVVEMPKFRAPGAARPFVKWAIAAGLAGVSLWAGRDRLDRWMAPSGARATVESVSGPAVSLAVGAKLAEGEVIRTGAGSRAILRLADGSRVEMNERAALAVEAAWSGQTLRLEHGDVILQAAKQRRGHLRVATRDAEAAVKGTIFAVSTGVAGSLVAVVEGSVEVDRPGVTKKLLKRGEHASTNQSLDSIDTPAAIAWSQDAAQYLALLSDLQKIEKAVMEAPGSLRTQSRLLPLLPAGTVFYGAAPNVGDELARAIEARVRESAVMKEWWSSPRAKDLQTLINVMQSMSVLLGNELVYAMAFDPVDGRRMVPVALAEVRVGKQADVKALLDKTLAGGVAYRFAGDNIVLSSDAASLARVMTILGKGLGTPFAAELQARYARGAGWLAALDFQPMLSQGPLPAEAQAFGLERVRHLMLEQRPGFDNEALLAFNGARTGVPAWLATPGPSGSAEYASNEAVLVASAVTKNPRQAFDELMNQAGKVSPGLLKSLRDFEQATGVSISGDLAGALGTDLTLSLETPTLPFPGWFLAAECYRPEALESAIAKLVANANQKLPAEHKLTLTKETVNGRVWTTLKPASMLTMGLYWTYDRGYWIVSMDRATALRAIGTRGGGFPLIRSAKFLAELPRGAGVHQSAFVWMNMNNALVQMLAQSANPAIKGLTEDRGPVLLTFNAQTERIQASSRTRLSSLLIDFAMAGMKTTNAANTTTRRRD